MLGSLDCSGLQIGDQILPMILLVLSSLGGAIAVIFVLRALLVSCFGTVHRPVGSRRWKIRHLIIPPILFALAAALSVGLLVRPQC